MTFYVIHAVLKSEGRLLEMGRQEMSGVTEERVSAQTLGFWLRAPAVVVTPLGDLQLGVFVQPDWA